MRIPRNKLPQAIKPLPYSLIPILNSAIWPDFTCQMKHFEMRTRNYNASHFSIINLVSWNQRVRLKIYHRLGLWPFRYDKKQNVSFHFPFQFLRISHPIIDFIHLDLLFIYKMSVLKGYKNQEIILSDFDFPMENYSGLLVMRDKKQGNFIKSFSSQCQLGVAPEASLGGSYVWYSDQGKAKYTRANGKCL